MMPPEALIPHPHLLQLGQHQAQFQLVGLALLLQAVQPALGLQAGGAAGGRAGK